jgi:hypothetical protein
MTEDHEKSSDMPSQSEAETSKPTRLEKFRVQVLKEEEKRYLNMADLHHHKKMNFQSQRTQLKLNHIEELIKEVYKNQRVSKRDLEIRDEVINRIKDAFFKASHKDYPVKMTGEILISGFGSCHNGSWNQEKSDIDVTAVFFDSLTHNHH